MLHSFENNPLSLLPRDIWIDIASLLSPQDLESFKQACKTFFQLGQSDKISKVSHDLLYNRLRKLDPSLPMALPATGFQAQYQNDLKKVTQQITDEIAYLRVHHNTLVKHFIDTLNLEKLAPLQRLEKYSSALDDLNIEIIQPFIDGSAILDLTGIGITRIPRRLIHDANHQPFWKNLHTLYCDSNKLTALNLQGVTNLTTLYCQDNRLTALNLKGLAALFLLDCSDNQLTVLVTQSLTALKSLICSNNKLKALDVQGLSELQCGGNQLATLDLHKLTALEVLDCSDNELTELDLQGLTQLHAFNCENNRLTALHTQGLAALQALNCKNNQLTMLDLQGLTAIDYLDCSHNQLTMLPNTIIAKFGEEWVKDALASQRKPAPLNAESAQTTVATALLNQHKKRKRAISAREAQELNSDADKFLNLKTKKFKN